VRDLLLVGAGGFARETAEAVRAVNAVDPTWNLLGFLDDRPRLHGTVVTGTRVAGPVDLALERPDALLAICTGRPDNYESRRRIAERLALPDERYATIVHPSVSLSPSSRVGAGSVLLAHVDLTADVEVGRHVAVMPQVVLTHDDRVGDWATIASGVRVGGATTIGPGAYIGAGACLREHITVGEWALVGMGSLVTRDVSPRRLWYGSPARDAGPAPLREGKADNRRERESLGGGPPFIV
jgi:sugar O-acyltransferase (sialic acid O-acetyltransferase NeuD family)